MVQSELKKIKIILVKSSSNEMRFNSCEVSLMRHQSNCSLLGFVYICVYFQMHWTRDTQQMLNDMHHEISKHSHDLLHTDATEVQIN